MFIKVDVKVAFSIGSNVYWVTGLDIVIMKHFRKSHLSDKHMKNDKFYAAFNWRFIK